MAWHAAQMYRGPQARVISVMAETDATDAPGIRPLPNGIAPAAQPAPAVGVFKPMGCGAMTGEPVLCWNARLVGLPPVVVRFVAAWAGDPAYWTDAATAYGGALYFNLGYFTHYARITAPANAAATDSANRLQTGTAESPKASQENENG